MKKNKSILIVIILILGLFDLAKTQINTLYDDWRWIYYSTESGLPSNRVFDIIESTAGIVWAQTQSGLAWFNGYSWDTLSQTAGLPSIKIEKFLSADNGNILVLTEGKLFYGNQNGFKSIPFNINNAEKRIKSIATLHDGQFICQAESTVYLINKNTTPMPFSKNLGEEKIIKLWSTNGAPWLNTINGLYRFENNEWTLKLKAESKPIVVSQIIESEKGDGLSFLIGPRKYFGLWEWKSGGIPVFNTKSGVEHVLAADIELDGHVFMVKESNICMSYDSGKWNAVTPTPDQFQNIIFLKYRSNGDIWVSTESGLYLYRKNYNKWIDIRFPEPDVHNNVNEIIQRKDGSVWIGTGRGLIVYKPGGAVKIIEKINDFQLGLITGIAEDANGNLWLTSGSSFEGAYRWNGSQLRYFGVKDGLDAGYIHRIKKDKHGNLWFLGLARSNFESRNIEEEPGAYIYSHGTFKQWEKKQGLMNGRVYDMEEGTNGALWFGTNGGLCRWMPDSVNGRWTYWTTSQGLKMNRVFTIAIDSTNTVWFGDQNNGLGFIENDAPKYLTTQNGLISDAVWRITADATGKLWIGTRGGVSIYDHGNWSFINSKEGLEFTSIWPVLVTNNRAFIGSFGGGMCILNLDAVSKQYPEIILDKPIIHEGVLYLKYKTFSFWGVQRPGNIEVRYKIDNALWARWTHLREIVVGDLPWGNHTLQLQAKNLVGEFNQQATTISFYVEPPLYLQPLFYLPIGILSLGFVLLGVKYLKRKQRQTVELRKSEIRYRNLFDMANDAIIIIEPKNEVILEANKKAIEVYGFSRDELIGKSIKSICKNLEFGKEMIKQNLNGRAPKSFDSVHLTKAGNEIDMHINASVINYDGNEAILSLNRDVTENKLAEAKIRLLAQTIASAQDYVSIIDLEDNILFVNDAFCKAYGYSAEELIGNNNSIIRSEQTSAETLKQISLSVLQDGWNGEILNKKKDGSLFLVELWTSVVKNERGEPVATVGIARDISERKRYESEREKLITELKAALADVKMLSGLLPICSSCKKIRDDGGYWTQVETYVEKHSEATFTHGLCPDCAKKYFPEVYEKLKNKNF